MPYGRSFTPRRSMGRRFGPSRRIRTIYDEVALTNNVIGGIGVGARLDLATPAAIAQGFVTPNGMSLRWLHADISMVPTVAHQTGVFSMGLMIANSGIGTGAMDPSQIANAIGFRWLWRKDVYNPDTGVGVPLTANWYIPTVFPIRLRFPLTSPRITRSSDSLWFAYGGTNAAQTYRLQATFRAVWALP